MKVQHMTKPNDKPMTSSKEQKKKRYLENSKESEEILIKTPNPDPNWFGHLPTSWAVQRFSTPSSAWKHMSWLSVKLAGWKHLEIAGDVKKNNTNPDIFFWATWASIFLCE